MNHKCFGMKFGQFSWSTVEGQRDLAELPHDQLFSSVSAPSRVFTPVCERDIEAERVSARERECVCVISAELHNAVRRLALVGQFYVKTVLI